MQSRTLGASMAIVSIVAMGASGEANAQESRRWYVAAGGTIAFLQDVDQTVANAPAPGSTLFLTNEGKTGFGGYAALGHRFGPVRAEFEYGRTENDSDRYMVTSPFMATIDQVGELDINRFMANAFYDFKFARSRFSPYVGAGVGAASIYNLRIAATAFNPTPIRLIDDNAATFAWQAMAGVAFSVTPRLQLTTQYRWFDAGTVDFEDARSENVTADIAGSHIEFGLRFAF